MHSHITRQENIFPATNTLYGQSLELISIIIEAFANWVASVVDTLVNSWDRLEWEVVAKTFLRMLGVRRSCGWYKADVLEKFQF